MSEKSLIIEKDRATHPNEPFQTDQELEAILVTDPFPDMSEEEILFWHSDYYDSIQEEKQAKQEAILKEKQVRNE